METLQEKYRPLLSGILPENTEIVFVLYICTTKGAVIFGKRSRTFRLVRLVDSSSVCFLILFLFRHDFFFFHRRKAYPDRAPNTKKMQTSIHAAIAVIPSVLGELVVTI